MLQRWRPGAWRWSPFTCRCSGRTLRSACRPSSTCCSVSSTRSSRLVENPQEKSFWIKPGYGSRPYPSPEASPDPDLTLIQTPDLTQGRVGTWLVVPILHTSAQSHPTPLTFVPTASVQDYSNHHQELFSKVVGLMEEVFIAQFSRVRRPDFSSCFE